MKSQLAVVLSLVFALGASAATMTIEVEGVRISVPIPKEYGSPAVIMPQALTLGESMTPLVNRLQLVLMSAADLKRARAGKDAQWDRYLMVQTNRKAEAMTFTESDFAKIRKGFVEGQATLVEQNKDAIQRQLAGAAPTISAATGSPVFSMKLGETLPLGVFANSNPNSIAFGSIVKYSMQSGGRTIESPVVVAIAIAAVRQKLMFFYVYSTYRTKADVDDVKQTTTAWLADIATANK